MFGSVEGILQAEAGVVGSEALAVWVYLVTIPNIVKTSSILLVVCSLSEFAGAQVPLQLNLNFDPSSEFMLDSIYPGTLWQVGPPDKPVFDSAYSAPNALVTDTLLPYGVVNGPEYAEFIFPVNFYGEMIELHFKQRLDINEGEAWGWLEFFEPGIGWSRIQQEGGWGGESLPGVIQYFSETATSTDSGLVYLQATAGWSAEYYRFICNAVLVGEENRGGDVDTMRFRFAFRSTANSLGRDGWMIDDVYIENLGTCSGIEEHSASSIQIVPDPADDMLTVSGALKPGVLVSLGLFDQQGRLIWSERRSAASAMCIQTGWLKNGAYTLRIADSQGMQVGRFVVQH